MERRDNQENEEKKNSGELKLKMKRKKNEKTDEFLFGSEV